VRISPPNQTLLLASDRAGARAAGQRIMRGGGNSYLQRVTIVTAQPDSVVYVRADYLTAPPLPAPDVPFDPNDDNSSGALPSNGGDLVPRSPTAARKDSPGNPRASLTASSRPTDHYALVQRLTDAPLSTTIDVFA
jgi:hypothetical protein